MNHEEVHKPARTGRRMGRELRHDYEPDRAEKLPFFKVGNQWRAYISEIEKLVDEKIKDAVPKKTRRRFTGTRTSTIQTCICSAVDILRRGGIHEAAVVVLTEWLKGNRCQTMTRQRTLAIQTEGREGICW